VLQHTALNRVCGPLLQSCSCKCSSALGLEGRQCGVLVAYNQFPHSLAKSIAVWRPHLLTFVSTSEGALEKTRGMVMCHMGAAKARHTS
jgi:hypothetical protein